MISFILFFSGRVLTSLNRFNCPPAPNEHTGHRERTLLQLCGNSQHLVFVLLNIFWSIKSDVGCILVFQFIYKFNNKNRHFVIMVITVLLCFSSHAPVEEVICKTLPASVEWLKILYLVNLMTLY